MAMEIHISVRGLVEFLLRSGDLDNRIKAAPEAAMQAGSRMHRRLQKQAGAAYTAEVALSYRHVFAEAPAIGAAVEQADAANEAAQESQPSASAGTAQKTQPEQAAGTAQESTSASGTGAAQESQQEQAAGTARESQSAAQVPAAEQPGLLTDAAVVIEGRADGIYRGRIPLGALLTDGTVETREKGEECFTIDEIKTTYRNLAYLKKPEPVHVAQAKCYAYIYAFRHRLSSMHLRMTYCNLDTEEIKYFYERCTFQELRVWFETLMAEYRKWAEFTFTWQALRTQSIKRLSFPFPYREGQRELAEYCYRTIVHGRKLFLEAPTGAGKTLTTLFPALKAMGEGKAEKIFYLTAKTIARTVADDTVTLLRERGLRCKSVVLTAKEKICVLERPECNPKACPRARGHFDRINAAMYELLTQEERFDRTAIEACAARYEVCPFELALDMSLFSDVVICDYNYVFDPHVALRRFFGEGEGRGAYLFLIDEAHNLVERGREMYSATLVKEEVLTMLRAVRGIYPKLEKPLCACNSALLTLRRETEAALAAESGEADAQSFGGAGRSADGCRLLPPDDIDALAAALYRLQAALDDYLEEDSRRRRSAVRGEPEKPAETQKAGAAELPDKAAAGRRFAALPMRRKSGDAATEGQISIFDLNSQYKTEAEKGDMEALSEAAEGGGTGEFDEAIGDDGTAAFSESTGNGGAVLAETSDDSAAVLTGTLSESPPGKRGKRKKRLRALLTPEEAEALHRQILDFFFTVSHFLLIYEKIDERYVLYAQTGEESFFVKLFNVDPSGNLRECMDKGRASLLFSATLLPIRYYKQLLGGTDEDYEVYAQSVFDPRRRALLVADDVTSKYSRRGPEEYAQIAAYIRRLAGARHGNYMVFFPSYAFLRRVLEAYTARYETPEVEIRAQSERMSEAEKEAFLERFAEVYDDRSFYGFCVLGGIFSEGIDLKNDALIGVIVVGTGLPQVCGEREILKNYFAQTGVNGYDYAYRFPGMNKVLQAAGRVIRTQEDVGVVALLDERFLQSSYRRLFPREWENFEEISLPRAAHRMDMFWDEWL